MDQGDGGGAWCAGVDSEGEGRLGLLLIREVVVMFYGLFLWVMDIILWVMRDDFAQLLLLYDCSAREVYWFYLALCWDFYYGIMDFMI